jgi:hypothetical protein
MAAFCEIALIPAMVAVVPIAFSPVEGLSHFCGFLPLVLA